MEHLNKPLPYICLSQILLFELNSWRILSTEISAARERRDLEDNLSEFVQGVSDLDDRGKLCVPYPEVGRGRLQVRDTCGPISYCNLEGIPTCKFRWWFIAAIVAAIVLVISLIACACRGCM